MKSDRAAQMALPLGRGDLQRAVKAAVARTLKQSSLSREQIADRINSGLEAEGNPYRVTPAMIDRWAAPSDASHNLPAWLAPAFCRAVESFEVAEILAAALGFGLAGEKERHLIALGQAQMESKKLARRKRRALEALEEMGE